MKGMLAIAAVALAVSSPPPVFAQPLLDRALATANDGAHLIQIQNGRGRGRDREERGDRGRQGDRSRDDRFRQPPPLAPRDRGQYLPPGGRGAQVQDPNRFRLRQPPPGYDWVQVGRDIYLTQRSTGLVVEAIPGGR